MNALPLELIDEISLYQQKNNEKIALRLLNKHYTNFIPTSMTYTARKNTKQIPLLFKKVITHLDLSKNDFITSETVEEMFQLQYLSLKCNNKVKDSALTRKHINIIKLDLSYNNEINYSVLNLVKLNELILKSNFGITNIIFDGFMQMLPKYKDIDTSKETRKLFKDIEHSSSTECVNDFINFDEIIEKVKGENKKFDDLVRLYFRHVKLDSVIIHQLFKDVHNRLPSLVSTFNSN